MMAAALLLFGSQVALGDNAPIQCGPGVYGTLDAAGTLTISGTGDMFNYASGKDSPFYKIASQIASVVVTDGVTSVGDYMFSGTASSKYFYNLYSVSISGTVKTVGSCAFQYANKLRDIYLGDGVKTIGERAFAETGATNVRFPNGLQTIGSSAFRRCSNLGKGSPVIFPQTLIRIEDYAFYICHISSLTIPESVSWIGDYALYGTTMNVTIRRKDSMYIGSKAFSGIMYGFAGTPAARWAEANKSRVTFKAAKIPFVFSANGGTVNGQGAVSSEESYGEKFATLPGRGAMKRAGYVFAGWYTDPVGGARVTASSTVSALASTTLYAHWQQVTVAQCKKPGAKNKANRTLQITLKKLSGADGYRVRISGKKVRTKTFNLGGIHAEKDGQKT